MSDPFALGRKEREASPVIPYLRHVDETTIALDDGGLLSILELDGLPFETADVRDVNAHHRGLNTLWKNVADDAVMLWSIVLRRRTDGYSAGKFTSSFAQTLDNKYRGRLDGDNLYRNRLFLAVLRQPGVDAVDKSARLLGKLSRAKTASTEVDADQLKKHHDAVRALEAGLTPVGARVLGLYDRGGLTYSAPAEILHQLLGGRQARIPLTDGPIWSSIHQDRIVFGRETAEIRHEDRSHYAAIYGLKEYPAVTHPGMLDDMLTAPFELTAVQSFRFVAKAKPARSWGARPTRWSRRRIERGARWQTCTSRSTNSKATSSCSANTR